MTSCRCAINPGSRMLSASRSAPTARVVGFGKRVLSICHAEDGSTSRSFAALLSTALSQRATASTGGRRTPSLLRVATVYSVEHVDQLRARDRNNASHGQLLNEPTAIRHANAAMPKNPHEGDATAPQYVKIAAMGIPV